MPQPIPPNPLTRDVIIATSICTPSPSLHQLPHLDRNIDAVIQLPCLDDQCIEYAMIIRKDAESAHSLATVAVDFEDRSVPDDVEREGSGRRVDEVCGAEFVGEEGVLVGG